MTLSRRAEAVDWIRAVRPCMDFFRCLKSPFYAISATAGIVPPRQGEGERRSHPDLRRCPDPPVAEAQNAALPVPRAARRSKTSAVFADEEQGFLSPACGSPIRCPPLRSCSSSKWNGPAFGRTVLLLASVSIEVRTPGEATPEGREHSSRSWTRPAYRESRRTAAEPGSGACCLQSWDFGSWDG